MQAYEAYVLFLAIKRHFTTKDYNAFKYAFKVKTSVNAFEKRNDRYFFDRLAKFEDPRGLLVAACTREDASKLFIGNLIRDPRYLAYYGEYKSTKEAIEYLFETEISTLQPSDFKVKSGEHPRILDQYFRRELSLETITIVQRETNLIPYWNKNIRDRFIWPDVAMKIEKYAPFLRYDKARVRKALAEVSK